MIYIGIDTGGTFTDLVLIKNAQLRIHKILSTPAHPERAILDGLDALQLGDLKGETVYLVHGSTVATNAVLEGKGVRTALITNRGLGDLLSIGRQARRELYNLQPAKRPPPVEPEYCIECGGRLGADAEVVDDLSDADLQAIKQRIQQLQPQAVAINLLFSFLDGRFEKRIADNLPKELFVSCSSQLLPQMNEYERGMTTWLNASVGPIVAQYLQHLDSGLQRWAQSVNAGGAYLSVMQSSGGTIAATQAAHRAVNLLLSGPAGGLAAAQFVAALSNRQRLLTFDMGGTSTDVALIDGSINLTDEGQIAGYPVGVPMVDMHTIGAGGGSIARVDEGGLLQVGPQSAGADPGPACYGKGGQAFTVTDANLLLGRLRSEAFLGGRMQLHVEAARQAALPLAKALNLSVNALAEGVVRIANEHMVSALRVMSVQRGIDPRQLSLVCFGGAGGLHVCALADALGMKHALIPLNGGVLSAVGMLVAPRSRQLSHSILSRDTKPSAQQVDDVYQHLEQQGRSELMREGVEASQIQIQRSIDLRYEGQSYSLNLPWCDREDLHEAFHQLHENRYGHRLPHAVQWVTARVSLQAPACLQATQYQTLIQNAQSHDTVNTRQSEPGGTQPTLWHRHQLQCGRIYPGPALICETVATAYVDAGWSFRADRAGNILLMASDSASV